MEEDASVAERVPTARVWHAAPAVSPIMNFHLFYWHMKNNHPIIKA